MIIKKINDSNVFRKVGHLHYRSHFLEGNRMILRGINFGPILDGSGAEGFFGEGYWYHKYLKPLGLNFEGSTFVAKTTTLRPRLGNLPLKEDGITPRERFPKCIKVYPHKGIVLNAVGLSGPGAEFLFADGRWQRIKKPFFISFMAVGESFEMRYLEAINFAILFKKYLHGFSAPVGLQINFSCPNVGLNPGKLIAEIKKNLEIISSYLPSVPLVPKINALTPPEAAKKMTDDPNCDALCVSNTIPWGALPDKINWKKLFGTNVSSLAEFGDGGMSGKLLLPIVSEWLADVRRIGITKPIIAGGGILSPEDVDVLKDAGASSVSVSSVAILRGWRVRKIIRRANEIFGGK